MDLKKRASVLSAILDTYPMGLSWRSMLRDAVARSNIRGKSTIYKALGEASATIDPNPILGLSLTQVSVLYEFSLAYTNPDSRKDEGQYFTPEDVADFMAAKSRDFPDNSIWLDPCCGVGNLTAALANAQDDPELFLAERMRLLDKDPLALLLAQVLLTLNFQNRDAGLFNKLRKASHCIDALTEELPDFDCAILNPPYVVVPANESFQTSACRDLYAYFLEVICKRASGFIAVTPQSFTTAAKFASLRTLLARANKRLRIYCFDNVPDTLFRGFKYGSTNSNKVNSTRAAITVMGAEADVSSTITPLVRWKSTQRETLFAEIDNLLIPFVPGIGPYPKLHGSQVIFHRELNRLEQKLEHIISIDETPYALEVATTPRYYLSATKRVLSRGGKIRLYFKSESDLNRAYLLLNSSLAYWWWRTHDGGITLNRTTLMSIPWITSFELDSDLISMLEESEKANLVTKTNAGQRNENVKHSLELLALLNLHISRKHGTSLLISHSNSLPATPNHSTSVGLPAV